MKFDNFMRRNFVLNMIKVETNIKKNLLDAWKKECFYLSSEFSLHKQFERSVVDSVYKTFSDYFGINYFNIEGGEQNISAKENWIFYLLASSNRRACMAALFEITNTLLYLQTLSRSIQKKFKSVFNDPQQFRDLFFELYIFRLMEFNKISHLKKPKENGQELDVVCTINNQDYLGECLKVYAPNLVLLHNEKYFMTLLTLKLSSLSKGFGMIGMVKFSNPNSENVKKVFTSKLEKFVKGFNAQKFINIGYYDKDDDGEFSVIDYSVANNLEAEMDFSNYHVMFKYIPPFSVTQGIFNHYRIELKGGLVIPQYKIIQKLFSTLKVKSEQHKNSAHANKIYFIDSEAIPDFNPAIFMDGSVFPEEEIQDFINEFSDKEIFCFILRNYTSHIPKVTIKVLGKNIDDKIKHRLENLKTNFDFTIIKPRMKSNFLILPN